MTDQACRLYLVTPPRFDPEVFAGLLEAVLAALDIASLEIRLEDAGPDDWLAAVNALMPLTLAHDVALLLADRPQIAAGTGCDGVCLSFLESYAEARRFLGEDAIIGVAARGSRHEAMEAGERGAAFVGIGPAAEGGVDADLVSWWADLMEVPCVAFGVRTPEDAVLAVEAGADFLCPDPAFWEAAEGPVAALTRLLAGVAFDDDDDAPA
ncbi:MAG: thiamine phosphate synthase [Alphaproteobacteria bacterium]|jgi:thiamine-phosphate pyrophosphorylase|nr:thiamine phosphate synthase [Alphaproteobacteria bacterium]